jgi:hypothetical protein
MLREYIVRLIVICLVMLGVLFMLAPVKADSSIQFGGISHHFISDDTTNNFHRAIIVNHEDYLVGYLRNSYGQDSFVAAYNIYGETKKNYSTDVYLGAVRGYDKCYGAFEEGENKSKVIACPLLVINVTINTETMVKPVLSIWGDALVLTGKIDF